MPETGRGRVIPPGGHACVPRSGRMRASKPHSASIPSYPLHPGLLRWNACMGTKVTPLSQKQQSLLLVLSVRHQRAGKRKAVSLGLPITTGKEPERTAQRRYVLRCS